MVARLIEGWESSTALADYAGKWTTLAAASIGPAAGRSGNGMRGASSNHFASRTFDAQATWVVGFALRASVLPTNATAIVTLLDGATTHCGIALQNGTGLLFAWRGTTATILGTSSAGIAAGVWAYVEAKFTIGDTGSVAVRLNGVTVLDLPTADTRNAGNASANVVRVGPVANPSPANLDLDDLYLFDGSGSVNVDFAGECRVEAVLPTGAGATTAWTPSAGSNYACVDEAPPNGDTDYVSSSTAAQTDTYAYGDLAVATSGLVKVVQATALARKDDAGSRSLALVARPGGTGGTDQVGATQGVADTYAAYPQTWDTNPDTAAAWTVAETNASQFGIRLIA